MAIHPSSKMNNQVYCPKFFSLVGYFLYHCPSVMSQEGNTPESQGSKSRDHGNLGYIFM